MEQKKRSALTAALRKPDPAQMRLIRRIAMIVLAVVMAFSVCLIVFGLRGEKLRSTVSFSYTGELQRNSIYTINIDEAQQTQKVKDTPRHGQKTKFRYFSNTELVFDYPLAYTPLLFGNVSSNDCTLVFSIVDDQSGILMYRSGGVEPGSYVSQIRLLHAYTAGVHTCRMYVAAYDRETYAFRGVQYTDLSMIVGG